jgi:hypothetical protein
VIGLLKRCPRIATPVGRSKAQREADDLAALGRLAAREAEAS